MSSDTTDNETSTLEIKLTEGVKDDDIVYVNMRMMANQMGPNPLKYKHLW